MMRVVFFGAGLAVMAGVLALSPTARADMAAQAAPLIAGNALLAAPVKAFGVARLTEGLNGTQIYFSEALPSGPKEGQLLLIASDGSSSHYPVVIGARQKTTPADAPLINGKPGIAYRLIPQPALQAIPPQTWTDKVALIHVATQPAGGTGASTGSAPADQTTPSYTICRRQSDKTEVHVEDSPPWVAVLPAVSSDKALKTCP
ncbi:hypothetical protein SAMN05421779_103613 [Insolitispirillum peregrinum]|uniref:Uncharacterized protein n=2 Tax=Insolitispirillum peregrinum TaxID=80876 RepID=A0A1N7LXG6_9PROT|nr:hypothetical protein SAMN05421779_103613 [Insolitispirillum peregrinum]